MSEPRRSHRRTASSRARDADCRVRIPRLLLVACLAIACRSTAPVGVGSERGASSRPRPLRVFLLVGSANMFGRAPVESQDSVAVAHVLSLSADGQWIPAVDPLAPGAAVGPGRAFGIAVEEALPEADVGLVPAAVSGTSIVQWTPGAVDPSTGAHPYDDAVARARVAMQSGTLAAILWHQGEIDASPANAPRYGARLRALVQQFRTDLGAPDVPVLVGQVGQFRERPWTRWRAMVDDSTYALPRTVPQTGYVSSAGLTHRGDSLTFDARSARELGRRYAAKYLRLRDTAATP